MYDALMSAVPRMRVTGLGVALAIALGLFVVALLSVRDLERAELEAASPWRTLEELRTAPGSTRVSARLLSAHMRKGEQATFELCSRDGLPDSLWQGALDFAVLHLGQGSLVLRVPLDAAHLEYVKRNSAGGCLLLGSGTLEHDGEYSVDAVWPDKPVPDALTNVPLRARVLGKPALSWTAVALLFALGASVVLVLVLLLRARPHRANAEAQADVLEEQAAPTMSLAPPPPNSGLTKILTRVALGLVGSAIVFGATQLPLYGATLTLVKALLLLGLQVGLAFLAMRLLGERRSEVPDALALTAARSPKRALFAAVVAWPLLVVSARLALLWVPSTGEAPIEAFVSWPSGMLSAALLGAFLPVGEEIFFRGYLYGSLLPVGRAAAFVVSLLAFVLLHAQQTWGNWGALAAVFAAGTVLTGLRAYTGSCLVPALTHAAYNLSLSLASLHRALGP